MLRSAFARGSVGRLAGAGVASSVGYSLYERKFLSNSVKCEEKKEGGFDPAKMLGSIGLDKMPDWMTQVPFFFASSCFEFQ